MKSYAELSAKEGLFLVENAHCSTKIMGSIRYAISFRPVNHLEKTNNQYNFN
ncbi:hypothetical protein [Sphingobacterium haloxyli]|uniref:hypothetical protein n=1 Tax=Sphingobacterium haloxyli TaxID=2100533 RepID=UPI0013FDA7D9|nr:hypothetical protein [Sphingobacterium haloxyli]